YHAGNFADVVKHVCLIALLQSFLRKPTPFCYLDTHAGNGYYDLFDEFSAKKKEYANGVEKVIAQNNPPPLVKDYLKCVHQINSQLSATKFSSLRYYPGSPMIARHFMRPQDSIIACELQLEVYQALKKVFAGDAQTAIHHQDGFLGLKAFLPPSERRGLVLIDPPYEDPDEFTRIVQTLPRAIQRWDTGTYAIWLPIKEKKALERFYRAIQQTINFPIFAIELTIYPELAQHLNGCALVIINPPWQFDQTMQTVLPWLWKALTINNQGAFRAYSLK
ncbi:MAG TPA: 23S rRNA (adenine(2030)-N(6))-methyltransferase RlmJ, partial [Gammaproteobacteria bacterium]|nr:23S rRNA (adenine(2030)-N(6))-methyltransferase RlmJ [Gammaproteobacteria bacterium]